MSVSDSDGPTVANLSGEQKASVRRNISVNRFQVSKLKLDADDTAASASSVITTTSIIPDRVEVEKSANEALPSGPMQTVERKTSGASRFENITVFGQVPMSIKVESRPKKSNFVSLNN
uniref:Uncharacterized protein n=1 Tax=Setaria digitata TaxID=48799 RepID=A0A915PW16_9BILA